MRHQAIPLSAPKICGNEWRYVKECLDTGWVSSVGSFVDRFEEAVAHYTHRRHAVACTTGTAALHTALIIAGIGRGDEVIMPSLTFAAPAFAVSYTGASPVFMDVEPSFWQLDIEKTADFLSRECRQIRGQLINRHTRRKVKALLPVHLLGHPVDIPAVMKLAKRYGLLVIEDVAESLGSENRGKKTGCGADMACFSFNGNKIVTCGGGGMLAINDAKLSRRARHLTTQARLDPVEYVHDAIGYNYRLTNVQAAIGLAQMENLDRFVVRKQALAQKYAKGLKGIKGIGLPQEAAWAKSIFWLYTLLVDQRIYGMDSRALMKKLSLDGIQSRPLWQPLHRQKIFKGCMDFHITEADRLHRDALSLPSSVGMDPVQQRRVMDLVRRNGNHLS